VPHLTDFDATVDQIVMRRFDVGNDKSPVAEPGTAAVIPLPNVTEHQRDAADIDVEAWADTGRAREAGEKLLILLKRPRLFVQ
jgi:hypothetical protein